MTQTRVLFVCLGNICRSPMADGVFQQLVADAGLATQIKVDSAGTGSWHVGDAPHPGTQRILRANGISYHGRARQVNASDMNEATSWIIAMDRDNKENLKRRFGEHPHLHLLLEFAHKHPDVQDIPDPYYTGNFEYVYELVQDGCEGLLAHIRTVTGI